MGIEVWTGPPYPTWHERIGQRQLWPHRGLLPNPIELCQPRIEECERVMKAKCSGNLMMSAAQRLILSKDRDDRIGQDLRRGTRMLSPLGRILGLVVVWLSIPDPQSRALGIEYDALIALGPAILPLVVEKFAADPANFMALQLYDAVQPDEKLHVHFLPDDERILEGEQGRARRVVKTWFANH